MYIRDLNPGDKFRFHGHMSVNTVTKRYTEANMTRVTYVTTGIDQPMEWTRVSLSTVLPVKES